MSTPLRVVRSAQSFAPTAPKFQSVRSLHITGAQAQPSSALAFQTRMAELRKSGERTPAPKAAARPFNTTRALAKPNDSSPIDFIYMPNVSSEADLLRSDIGLIPILPDNTTSSRAHHPILASPEPVARPEISTSSLASEGTVAAMSEADGGKQADSIGLVVEKVKEEVSAARQVWQGLLDDVLGPKKPAV